MTSLVIRYNVYILKDPKNFVNVNNCTIMQLQTKDQLMSTIGISFCNYQVAGEDPSCTNCAVANKGSPLHITKGRIGDFPYVIKHKLNCERDHL